MGGQLTKYKECPKCGYKNISFTHKCEQCNHDINDVVVRELISGDKIEKTTSDGFKGFISILSVIFLLVGIAGFIIILVNFTWVEVESGYLYTHIEKVFNPVGFGLAIGSLLTCLYFFASLMGIKKILDNI